MSFNNLRSEEEYTKYFSKLQTEKFDARNTGCIVHVERLKIIENIL